MRLGSSISVPAPNSAHLRREAQQQQQQQQQQQPSAKKLLTPFRTESINSSIADSNASSSLFQAESSNSERESISPSRINDSDQVDFSNFKENAIIPSKLVLVLPTQLLRLLIGILWP